MNPGSRKKQRGLALATALIGAAVLMATLQDQSRFSDAATPGVPHIAWTMAVVAGCILLIMAFLVFFSSFDRNPTRSVIRLDWFSPALRRLKPGQLASYSLLGRAARAAFPDRLQSDRSTKKRGLIRKGLRKLGISWLASPVRRAVQAICLMTFVTLFLYVSWPYDARPRSTDESSANWIFREFDAERGTFRFSRQVEEGWTVAADDSVFLLETFDTSSGRESVAEPFRVVSLTSDSISLEPSEQISSDLFDALVTSDHDWTLYRSDPTAWPSHYADNLAAKEIVPAEIFLIIDPLVSLSTAIASRSWVWSLASAGAILIVCILIPRGFCGYLCPLGTTIDLFDWAIGKRVERFRVPGDGWWVHIKYYLLAGTLLCSLFGVMVAGFFSAIPVITRAALFLVDPLQSGMLRGWHLVPGMHAGHLISIMLFLGVLSLGFLRPRFWCKYVCPSGAVFSLGNLFRVTERKVESSCINCNKCVEICPFDAIKPDFTTRTSDCTLCQSCGGVCPTQAIKFVERWNVVELKVENDPPTNETALGRRGFLSLATGSAAAVAGAAGVSIATKTFGARLDDPEAVRPVRPPGSVPEKEFLEMCIRCGECFKACPNNVLQPEGFQQGLEGLWAPMVEADWAGCESSCNACGQVCPTGAIRALPLVEKKAARMGLAIVNENTCLPFAGKEECDLCVQECNAAGYHAIEYMQVGVQLDPEGLPIEGTGYSAPVVLADKCVGCGLCQTRCNVINVKDRGVLSESAIIVEAGEGREDRMMSGSYVELRNSEQGAVQPTEQEDPGEYFLPPDADTDPFGVDGDQADQPADDDPFGTLGL